MPVAAASLPQISFERIKSICGKMPQPQGKALGLAFWNSGVAMTHRAPTRSRSQPQPKLGPKRRLVPRPRLVHARYALPATHYCFALSTTNVLRAVRRPRGNTPLPPSASNRGPVRCGARVAARTHPPAAPPEAGSSSAFRRLRFGSAKVPYLAWSTVTGNRPARNPRIPASWIRQISGSPLEVLTTAVQTCSRARSASDKGTR
jgi:hypothetical protein